MDGPPREAFFSGYYMNFYDFEKLVSVLSPEHMKPNIGGPRTDYSACVSGYDHWRRMLPAEERGKAPALKLILENPEANTPYAGGEDENNKFLFPTRYIPAPDHSLLDDYPQAMVEEESDIVRLDGLIAFIKQRHDFLVDKNWFRFGCFQHTHPYWDPLS